MKKHRVLNRPYDFQREDIRRFERWKLRGIDGSSMGLGKTYKALVLASRNITGTVVVVCPALAKIGWAREAEKHLGRAATVLYGRVPYRLPRGDHIWIINYDILWNRSSDHSWVQELQRAKPKLIITDEFQMVKESRARRSRAWKLLCDRVPHVLGLSGTPIEQRPMELWFPLSVIRPEMFPSKWHYGIEFCAGHKGAFGWDFSGHSNTERLHKILTDPDRGCMVRHLKEEVLKDLPPLTHTMLPVELTQRGMKEYREAVSDFLGWLRKKSKRRALRALAAEAMLRVGYLKRLAAQLKLPLVEEWVREFLESTDRKLIVYGIQYKVIRKGLYPLFGRKSVLVDGKVTSNKRQMAFDRFNNDPKCRLLFGNIEAAGVAWSCKSCDDVLFAELAFKPAQHAQAIDRVRGIQRGTGKPVNAWWVIAENTLEESLCKKLQKKANVVAQVLDGAEEGELQMLKFLIEVLKTQGKVRR